ncbi:MAG: chloride channel protein [Rikenellaceae bacterium]
MSRAYKILQRFYERSYALLLRLSHRLSNRQMMILLAVIIGVAAGFATYLFEMLLHIIKIALVSWFPVDESHILFLLYPTMGIILVTLFVKNIVRDNISEGVTRVLHAISRRSSILPAHNTWSSIVASSTTLGFGGSVGPEAPIVLTGAAIGSTVGRVARLNYRHTTLMLCCGAGAALAAIFKAPITGVVFVLEILMLDITVGSIIPLLIASISATTVAFMLRGFEPVLPVSLNASDAFTLWQIPLFILLGVVCGLTAYYLTSVNEWVGAQFRKLKRKRLKWFAGGLIIGLLIYIFPPLYGEGYEAITSLMRGTPQDLFDNSLFFAFRDIDWVIIIFLIFTMFFKVIAMSTTLAAGGIGGTFAPSLFMGAFCGAILALTCNLIFGTELSIVSFTLVGMSGVMSGVMKAPLTSIFLIAELSSGYGLFIPLMIVSSIAFAIDYYLEPESIYTKPLSKSGDLVTHNKDQSTLVFLSVEKLMETDFVILRLTNRLETVVNLIATAKRNVFPVLDEENRLIGIVQLDDLREDMFKREKYENSIRHYMRQSPDKILEGEPIQSVLRKFEHRSTWMLPVVDIDNRYLGFISKSQILNAYRKQLINISQ